MKTQLVLFSCFTTLAVIASFARAQDQYAVIVGVETYDAGTFENLNYSEEDASRLGQLLENFGYRVTVMTSQARSSKLKPYTPENILAVVKARSNSCAKGDTLIVSLSGHGVQFKDEDASSSVGKETYFCPENADLEDKSTLVPISKLIDLIDSSSATRKLLLIDACRNEVLSRAGQNKSSIRKIQLESVHESRMSIPGGMSVIFSCDHNQFSWESNELQRSVFSHFVTEYLDGNADDRFYDSGRLSLDDLVAYVRKKTNNYVFENNLSSDGQNPVVRGESANWPLVIPKALTSYDKAPLNQLRRHAKLGIVSAQYALGSRYYFEDDKLTQDFARAMKWYLKAAQQNNADAQSRLGFMFMEGQGAAVDNKQAMKWNRLAAKQGHAKAQNNIGCLYEHGAGVPQDQSEAVNWYRLAAEQGYVTAQNNLASSYFNGRGVDKSYTAAIKWFRKASNQNDASAQFNMGASYQYGNGVSIDFVEARKWYQKSAVQGNADSQTNLGFLYGNGKGTAKNYAEAMLWFRKAADQGHATAQHNVGYLYLHGWGVDQDIMEATKWFELSAAQGYEDAKTELKNLKR